MEPKCHKDRLQDAPNVLVRIPGKARGQRIGVVKFYEAGYYSTSADRQDWTDEQVNEFITTRNTMNGISEMVADSALNASMFGWHVPAAMPAIEWFKQFRLAHDD